MKNIKIDKDSGLPIYQQIIQQILLGIESGDLKPGDKLPTERDFCLEYGIARGTVKRAYSKLQKDEIISITQGKGTFIRGKEAKLSSFDVIERCIEQLLALSFSLDDIELFVADMLKERGEIQQPICACVVDTCPEILSGLTKSIKGILPSAAALLTEQIIQKRDCPIENADLIITREQNVKTLEKLLFGQKTQVLPIAAGLSPRTLESLAGIPAGSSIGSLCRTRQFSELIRRELADLDASLHFSSYLISAESSGSRLEDFLSQKEYLLAEPDYPSLLSPAQRHAADTFSLNGGNIIPLEYIMDEGSLLYIEEFVRKFHFTHYNIL